jgi:endonuclease/exonuclease/phosphatase family metal-dependent hydrolase
MLKSSIILVALIVLSGPTAAIGARKLIDIFPTENADQSCKVSNNSLKLLSLNIAHGRGNGLNQLLVSNTTIKKNLSDIARVLSKFDADVVALQEADGPSMWSGNFDHVTTLATGASYLEYVHTIHASSWLFNYGTALLSKRSFKDKVNYTFQPSPPTLNKGFTLGQISLELLEKSENLVSFLNFDVVSVHLDFSRRNVRENQIDEIIQLLAKRNNPLIIMGDFNSDWFSKGNVVRRFVEEYEMLVYRPEALDLATYAQNNRRLDWILISRDLEFVQYSVLPDAVSDQFAVVAKIVIKQDTD